MLIDDEPTLIARQLRQTFPAPAHRVEVARNGQTGIDRVRSESPDLVLLDLRLPDMSGLNVFRAIRQLDARIPVIFITLAKTTETAIEAMQKGAFDYLFKPLDIQELRRVIGEALEAVRRMREPAVMSTTLPDEDEEASIVGTCTAMREMYKAIGRISAQNVPVLITGETGTGKELVAQAIYQHSLRAQSPFLALNCAAIAESLQESELFGHEKGAFTGADRRRIGRFEQCDGGTIFLDEIGDMPMALQAKILRLLQEQTFERVGGNETIKTDVRVIAATHRDLKNWSETGKFRLDLYYRLGVVTIHLPPLRDRGDDVMLLVRHFLRRFSAEMKREPCQIDPEGLRQLRAYPWPGNVRELQSLLKRAILRTTGSFLSPESLFPDSSTLARDNDPAVSIGDRVQTLEEMEQQAIQQCLLQTGGNRKQTAALLGISTRTLLRQIRAHGLEDPRRRSGGKDSSPS